MPSQKAEKRTAAEMFMLSKFIWDLFVLGASMSLTGVALWFGIWAGPPLSAELSYIFNPRTPIESAQDVVAAIPSRKVESAILESGVQASRARQTPEPAPVIQAVPDPQVAVMAAQLQAHVAEVYRVEERLAAANARTEAAVLQIAGSVDELKTYILILMGGMGVIGGDKIPGIRRYLKSGERRKEE